MSREYYNDFAVPAAWAPLSAMPLGFQGTIDASAVNTAKVQVRCKSVNLTQTTLDGSLGEYLDHTGLPADLSNIEVQSIDSSTTQVLKIRGSTDAGWTTNAPATLTVVSP